MQAELEDLDMEDEEGGGGGSEEETGFVPVRDDAASCFKEHTGELVQLCVV